MKLFSWVLFAFLIAFNLSRAEAGRVSCRAVGKACFLETMPLYNQNDPGLADLFDGGDPENSVLCVPTAASMALATALAADEAPKSGSWTAKTFAPESDLGRIRAMARLMWTNASSGTGIGIEQYPLRAFDFKGYHSIHDQAWFRVIDDALIQDRLAQGALTVLNYGHYEEKCTSSMGGHLYLCTYKRKGGHELAVNGTLVDEEQAPFPRVSRIYDPWYAQVRSIRLERVANKSFMRLFGGIVDLPSLPYLGNTRAWRVNGSSVKVIDRLDSLKTGG